MQSIDGIDCLASHRSVYKSITYFEIEWAKIWSGKINAFQNLHKMRNQMPLKSIYISRASINPTECFASINSSNKIICINNGWFSINKMCGCGMLCATSAVVVVSIWLHIFWIESFWCGSIVINPLTAPVKMFCVSKNNWYD